MYSQICSAGVRPILICFLTTIQCCEKYEFKCEQDGYCIPRFWVCDGEDDCFDSSDEAPNCYRTMCNESQFECSNRRCIPLNKLCDNFSDCVDNSDEIGCCATECSYSRTENVFERTILHELVPEEFPGESDYLISVNSALDAYKNNESLTPQFGQFANALRQYYSSRAYEHYFAKIYEESTIEKYIDHVSLPNSTKDGNISFYGVKVFGYPSFMRKAAISTEIDPSPNIKDFTVHYTGTSDITIFSGFFKVCGDPFYFVYHTYDNVYRSDLNKMRTSAALIKPKRTNDSFFCDSEIFIHTYDSSLPKYQEVNATLYPTFQTVLKEVYLPKLSVLADAQIKPLLARETSKFGEIYRKKLIDAVVKAAKTLLDLTKTDSFQFTPVNLTRDLTDSKKMIHSYSAIMKGFTDFEKYELTNSSIVSLENGSILEFLNVLTFSYPQTSKKVAEVIFKATDQMGKTSTSTYVVKSIKLMASYKANISTFPVHVYPNIEKWKFTNSGYFAQIEMYDFNDFFDFIAYHINREIGINMGTILS